LRNHSINLLFRQEYEQYHSGYMTKFGAPPPTNAYGTSSEFDDDADPSMYRNVNALMRDGNMKTYNAPPAYRSNGKANADDDEASESVRCNKSYRSF